MHKVVGASALTEDQSQALPWRAGRQGCCTGREDHWLSLNEVLQGSDSALEGALLRGSDSMDSPILLNAPGMRMTLLRLTASGSCAGCSCRVEEHLQGELWSCRASGGPPASEGQRH